MLVGQLEKGQKVGMFVYIQGWKWLCALSCATTCFAGLEAQSWVEMKLMANRLCYLKSHWVRRRSTQVMCGWLRGRPLTSGACEILFSPGSIIANEMSAVRACFGKCQRSAETLPSRWSETTARCREPKGGAVTARNRRKKVDLDLFSGVWGQLGSRGRANSLLLLSPGNAMLEGCLNVPDTWCWWAEQ